MNLPSGARGRRVALGLLVITIAGIYQLTLAPLWQRYQALAPAIAEQRQQLQRYQRLAAQAPQLQSRLQALRDDVRFDDYLLPGTNSALAAAALQQRLQDQAQQHSGRVLSTRVLKAEQVGDFEQVEINARLQIDLAGLQDLLHGLETLPPYLFVRNLNVYRQASPRRMRGRPPNVADEQLEVQLDVYGLRLPKEVVSD
jgi:general secretion pathway protein M